MKIRPTHIVSIIMIILSLVILTYVLVRRNDNYKNIINTSMNAYFESNSIKDLDETIKVLDSYKYDKSMIKTINNYIYKLIGEKMIFIDELYTCNLDDQIECKQEVQELNKLLEEVTKLHTEKTNKGLKLIEDNDYNNIYEEINKKLLDIDKILELKEKER